MKDLYSLFYILLVILIVSPFCWAVVEFIVGGTRKEEKLVDCHKRYKLKSKKKVS